MTERLLPPGVVPRLLSREAAATYCGMSLNHFEEHMAPAVPPVRVGKRNLWDVKALDRWLDQQSGLAQATGPAYEWAGSCAARRKRTGPRRLRNAVLGAATGGIEVGIALSMYGALREGDVIRFPWSGYDGSATQWTQGNTGDDVWLPAHRELRTILDEAAKTRSAVTIVTDQSGLPHTGNGFRVMFFRLVRWLEAEGKLGPGLTFDGLRHTAGKMLDEAGCDTRTIGVVLGHRSEAMVRHYSEPGDRRRRAVAAIKAARTATDQKNELNWKTPRYVFG